MYKHQNGRVEFLAPIYSRRNCYREALFGMRGPRFRDEDFSTCPIFEHCRDIKLFISKHIVNWSADGITAGYCQFVICNLYYFYKFSSRCYSTVVPMQDDSGGKSYASNDASRTFVGRSGSGKIP